MNDDIKRKSAIYRQRIKDEFLASRGTGIRKRLKEVKIAEPKDSDLEELGEYLLFVFGGSFGLIFLIFALCQGFMALEEFIRSLIGG